MKNAEKKQTSINRTENKSSLNGVSEGRAAQIRQNSEYDENDLPSPDNNLFWEHASNPLSSKGN